MSGFMEAMHSWKPVSKEEKVAASSKVASRRICIERKGLKRRSEVRVDGSDAFTETSLERGESGSFVENGL